MSKEFKTIEVRGQLVLQGDTIQFRTLSWDQNLMLPVSLFPIPPEVLETEPKDVVISLAFPLDINSADYYKSWATSLAWKIVCEVFGTTKEKIKTKSRKHEILIPRQTLLYLLHTYMQDPCLPRKFGLSWAEITGLVSKDHATGIHSVYAIQSWLLQKEGFWSDKIRECIALMDQAVTAYRNNYAN